MSFHRPDIWHRGPPSRRGNAGRALIWFRHRHPCRARLLQRDRVSHEGKPPALTSLSAPAPTPPFHRLVSADPRRGGCKSWPHPIRHRTLGIILCDLTESIEGASVPE